MVQMILVVRGRFSLLVKWDKYGFYIHSSKPNPLYNFDGLSHIIQRKCVVGCEFHDHEDADDNDYVDEEQDEDDELSCSYVNALLIVYIRISNLHEQLEYNFKVGSRSMQSANNQYLTGFTLNKLQTH